MGIPGYKDQLSKMSSRKVNYVKINLVTLKSILLRSKTNHSRAVQMGTATD